MTAQIVWLDGSGVDPGEVGARAAALARLRSRGVAVPRGFVLGRSLQAAFTATARRGERKNVGPKLPPGVLKDLADALRALGGSCAVRRSPLGDVGLQTGEWQIPSGGRPERETYLHLTDVAEVHEAVRRIWGGGGLTGSPPADVAIVVQRFILPDVSAVARRDPVDPDVLHVQSTLGIGDLLAAGLVVPDRHAIRRHDGSILTSALGRKAQMSVPQKDGGLVRVPVPVKSAGQLAVDEEKLRELAATWRGCEEALVRPLAFLALSWSVGRWYVTGAVEMQADALDGILMG